MRALAALWLALSLVFAPSFALAAPPGAVPVQDDELDDILVDDDDLFLDEEPKKAPKKQPKKQPKEPARRAPEPEPEPEPEDDMPLGDADMPMGDYDLENAEAEPVPEAKPEPKPARKVVSEPEPARPVVTEPKPEPPTQRRTLLTDDEPRAAARPVATETEELARVGSVEPDESEGDGMLWAVTGAGAGIGALALVALGVGGYFVLSGLGGPTGTVTVTPH